MRLRGLQALIVCAALSFRRRLVRCIILASMLAAPAALHAATDVWKNPVSGLFSTGSNWVDGTAPTAADNAQFYPGTGPYTVTFTDNTTNVYLSFLTGNVTFQSGLFNHYEYSLTRASVWDELTLGTSQRSLDLNVGDYLEVGEPGKLNVLFSSALKADLLILYGDLIVDGAGASLDVTPLLPTTHTIGTSADSLLALSNSASGVISGVIDLAVKFSAARGTIQVQSGADLSLGSVNAGMSGVANHEATILITGVGSSITHPAASSVLTLGASAGSSGRLEVSQGGTFTNHGTTVLNPTGTIEITGGAANLGTLMYNGGTLNFLNGSLALNGDLEIAPGRALGGSRTLGDQQSLTLTGRLAIAAFNTLRLNGGTLSAAGMLIDGTLDFDAGAINIGSDGLWLGTTGVLDGTGPLNNTFLLRGNGKVTMPLNNTATGIVRAETANRLLFSSRGNTNLGQLQLLGGTIEFNHELTNSAGGLITGNGSLITNTLVNNGTMAFGGQANVGGDVSNNAGGRIISAGGATTFFGDVVNNGEIRTAQGSYSVFFGAVSGAGSYTGTGAVLFEGDLQPGNSPAAILVEGDLELGNSARLNIDLAGTIPGTQYDQLHVGGRLSLDGTLAVSLLDGFAPHYGDTFDLLDFGALAGRFDTLNLPALNGGLGWDTTSLYTTGAITAVPEPAAWLLAAVACGILWQACRRQVIKSR